MLVVLLLEYRRILQIFIIYWAKTTILYMSYAFLTKQLAMLVSSYFLFF